MLCVFMTAHRLGQNFMSTAGSFGSNRMLRVCLFFFVAKKTLDRFYLVVQGELLNN